MGLTLRVLRNTTFEVLYKKLLLKKEMSTSDYKKLLSLAIIFVNEKDTNINHLGYRIIVFYCNQTKNYKPLYDIALNKGITPLSKSIERIMKSRKLEETFLGNFFSAFNENFRRNDIYLTEQQYGLFNFFEENEKSTISVVAPTSYGKSSLIFSQLNRIKKYNTLILIPTKALLAQTKKNILEENILGANKLVTHPEMYTGKETSIIALLTQERLMRLLQKHPELYFDIVFVDEAHNLLKDDDRNILLATAISVLEKRNKKVIYKFLTPFLIEESNLKLRYTKYEPETYRVTEYIKTERLYLYDFRNENHLKIYDQFMNNFYYTEEVINYGNDLELVLKESSSKNILYVNKPIDIENLSSRLISILTDIESTQINKACKDLADYLHPDYFLIKCIRKGLIYHHGSVPDNIRVYIEHLFSKIDNMRYVISNSTLLEGINLEVNKMFILDNKKGNKNLTPSQLKNLIGRVCRFSEVFSNENNLTGLEPNIYLVISEYFSQNANVEDFIRNSMKEDKKIKDNANNILLENVDITEENKDKKIRAEKFIENFEKGTVTNYQKGYAKTAVGKYCFLNNASEINILDHEQTMQNKVDKQEGLKIINIKEVFDLFTELFLPFIDEGNNNLKRLSHPETRDFYQMFLSWRIQNTPLSEMINRFLKYWKKIENKEDTLVYVGRWGDEKRDGYIPLWTDIKYKDKEKRINLAIVRIKEEQEFLDNIFIKYIEILNDLNLLDFEFYLKIKYGTSDKSKITMIRNGLSVPLTNLISEKYNDYILIDNYSNTVKINSHLITNMVQNQENNILIHEVSLNTKLHL